jgi:transposase InsO family protein
VSLLTRRTWSLPHSDQHLLLHVEWWRAYYHFVRVHESLREPLPGGVRKHRQRTPAMAFGLTDRVWSVADILTMPLPPLEMAA